MWYYIVIGAVVLAVLVIWNKSSQVPTRVAQERLRQDAVILDVRTEGEFRGGHLARAINLPLDRFEAGLSQIVPDKGRPLLIHCQSGVRSKMATAIATRLGYTKAGNLGSLARARSIVEP